MWNSRCYRLICLRYKEMDRAQYAVRHLEPHPAPASSSLCCNHVQTQDLTMLARRASARREGWGCGVFLTCTGEIQMFEQASLTSQHRECSIFWLKFGRSTMTKGLSAILQLHEALQHLRTFSQCTSPLCLGRKPDFGCLWSSLPSMWPPT